MNVKEVADKLCENGELIQTSNETYKLSEVERKSLDETVREAENTEIAVRNKILSAASEGGRIDIAEKGDELWQRFHELFVVPFIKDSGARSYELVTGIDTSVNQSGIISMANSGPGTDGSQFFLTHLATPHLDGLHSVFGKVVSGLAVVNLLRRGDVINSISIEGDPSSLFRRRSSELQEWNRTLDENFPDLKPVLPATEN